MAVRTHLPCARRPGDQFHTITRDWFGKPAEAESAFRVLLSATHLTFEVRCGKAPEVDPSAEPGTFHEGLWQYDVAELFLGNPANGHYFEIHISGNGSWWSCHFEEERVRADLHNDPPEGAEATGEEKLADWSARLVIPITSLPGDLAFDPATTHGNVCFSLGTELKQQYLTWAPPTPGRPNFHDFRLLLPLRR